MDSHFVIITPSLRVSCGTERKENHGSSPERESLGRARGRGRGGSERERLGCRRVRQKFMGWAWSCWILGPRGPWIDLTLT